MNNLNKFIVILMLCLVSVAFIGCGGNGDADVTDSDNPIGPSYNPQYSIRDKSANITIAVSKLQSSDGKVTPRMSFITLGGENVILEHSSEDDEYNYYSHKFNANQLQGYANRTLISLQCGDEKTNISPSFFNMVVDNLITSEEDTEAELKLDPALSKIQNNTIRIGGKNVPVEVCAALITKVGFASLDLTDNDKAIITVPFEAGKITSYDSIELAVNPSVGKKFDDKSGCIDVEPLGNNQFKIKIKISDSDKSLFENGKTYEISLKKMDVVNSDGKTIEICGGNSIRYTHRDEPTEPEVVEKKANLVFGIKIADGDNVVVGESFLTLAGKKLYCISIKDGYNYFAGDFTLSEIEGLANNPYIIFIRDVKKSYLSSYFFDVIKKQLEESETEVTKVEINLDKDMKNIQDTKVDEEGVTRPSIRFNGVPFYFAFNAGVVSDLGFIELQFIGDERLLATVPEAAGVIAPEKYLYWRLDITSDEYNKIVDNTMNYLHVEFVDANRRQAVVTITDEGRKHLKPGLEYELNLSFVKATNTQGYTICLAGARPVKFTLE